LSKLILFTGTAMALLLCTPFGFAESKDQPLAHQVKVAIDPRSAAEMEQLVKGFNNSCPNVSIVRDENEAEYFIQASQADPWREWLLHFRITVFDKQGKVVFATDKHYSKGSTKEVCRFINAQK